MGLSLDISLCYLVIVRFTLWNIIFELMNNVNNCKVFWFRKTMIFDDKNVM